jgi:hypothetical protein
MQVKRGSCRLIMLSGLGLLGSWSLLRQQGQGSGQLRCVGLGLQHSSDDQSAFATASSGRHWHCHRTTGMQAVQLAVGLASPGSQAWLTTVDGVAVLQSGLVGEVLTQAEVVVF